MIKRIIKKSINIIKNSFLLLVALLSFFAISFQNSIAATGTNYGVERIRSCSSDGSIEGLDFDPTWGGKDIEFSLSNGICLFVIATSYASVKLAIANMNRVCGTGSAVPRVVPSVISDGKDVVAATAAATKNAACAKAVAAAASSLSVALIEFGAIYLSADHVYKNTEICGSNWLRLNPKEKNRSTEGYKKEVREKIEGFIREKINGDERLQLGDKDSQKTYREYYYGGVEFYDNPVDGNSCKDVARSPSELLGNYHSQRYYLQGLEPGNFNCERYEIFEGQNDPLTGDVITEKRLAEFREAYSCCKKRSSNYICIKYKSFSGVANTVDSVSDSVFCKSGDLCTIKGVTFEAKSYDNGRLICANTYSLCPYNFSISGGTQYCDYYRDGNWNEDSKKWKIITEEDIANGDCEDKSEIRNQDCTYNDKAGKCRNYCQYLNHCARTSGSSYQYNSSLVSPYFSSACLNFIGDSQNKISYGGDDGGHLLNSQRHFSAPIAQCVKETLENLFYNKVGHSKCVNINEYPSKDGICPSGTYFNAGHYIYKQGNDIDGNSFFEIIQNSLRTIVKLVLILFISFYGMKILTGKADVRNKKEVISLVIKIGLVLYFSIGTAWQTIFFEGVYGSATEFSMMLFNVSAESEEVRRDGCQFGEITNIKTGETEASKQNYPKGKEYLALWDTLDCKIMRYLGFGPSVSSANIASLVLAGFFTGPYGLYFAMSVMFFGFFFIALAIRALHIFLTSFASIIIMVFVSPIIIPTILFEKTKNIFDAWLKQLIGFCLQPMILFLYVAILITMIDRTLIGSATFHGSPPFKTISCKEFCQNSDETIEPYVNGQEPNCDQVGQRIIDPLNDSVACLVEFDEFGKFPGFEFFGITIPVIKNLFSGNIKDKILTILRGTIIIYLLYAFMDEITGIAVRLVGGAELKDGGASGVQMFDKAAGFASGIQERINRGGKKWGKKGWQKMQESREKNKKSGKGDSEKSRSPSGGKDDSSSSDSKSDDVQNSEES